MQCPQRIGVGLGIDVEHPAVRIDEFGGDEVVAREAEPAVEGTVPTSQQQTCHVDEPASSQLRENAADCTPPPKRAVRRAASTVIASSREMSIAKP